MTRSHRNDVPLFTSSNLEDRMMLREYEHLVHETTPWTLDAAVARPYRGSRSTEAALGNEPMSPEQYSRSATQRSTFHSMAADASDAVITDTGAYVSQTSRRDKETPVDVESYTQPFLSFISENPTTFHAVTTVCKRLESRGFTVLSERDSWANKLSRGGKYCFTRNGSSVIAFVVGDKYESGNGASVIASHIDALTTRVKPIPTLPTKSRYIQKVVAHYDF